MTFDSFARSVLDFLGDEDRQLQLTPDTRIDQLELDSLQRVELWLLCEDLGMDLPEQLFESLETIGDLFYYYETKVGDSSSS